MPHPSHELRIAEARPQDFDQVRLLLREYREWVGVDPCFTTFERELAELPGEYAPPGGILLLAWDGDELLGSVGMRGISWLQEGCCELKRLYVRPAGRGRGLGRTLVERVLEVARGRDYRWMRLDTLPHMHTAIALYRRYGFHPIERYDDNPDPNSLFFECDLQAGASTGS